jgi:TPR repeat protein
MLASPPAALLAKAEAADDTLADGQVEWQHLFEIANAPELDLSLSGLPAPEASTEILRGYGNALYKLGRRYEMGGGIPKNLGEAARCYRKAARLGNIMAFARLASKWLDARDASSDASMSDKSLQ